MLIDSHCHLDFPDFASEIDAVVGRARMAGIGTMLTIGTRLRAFEGVRAVAERFDNVWCSVGVHPHEAKEEPLDEASALIERTKHPKVVGIGEAGLDYYYEHSPRDDQIRNFRAHIDAARTTGLPLIVHTRDADDDMAAILSEEMERGPFTGLLHCFSSSRALAEKALALGFFISISGIVTFKKSDELRGIVADVNAENDPAFGATGKRLGEAVNELARTTDWLLANLDGAQDKALAGATPYLRIFGIAAGGCLLAKEALAALRSSAVAPAPLIAAARFFADHVATGAHGLADTVIEGADAIEPLPAAMLG